MSNTQTFNRCPWCGTDPLYVAYHDNEWGRIVSDDRTLFAVLCLEAIQAGLSWITVLRKRDAYYDAFDNFDTTAIALYDDTRIDKLMQNTGIIRHRAKIIAIIANAQAYNKITKNQSFYNYLWGILREVGDFPIDNRPKILTDIPTKTMTSEHLSKRLKTDGFKFVGATTCYAFMQAVGMVNDHLADCDFRI